MKTNYTPNATETESVLVGFDHTNGMDKSVLIVGKKRPKKTLEIINMFQGKEAEELWNKLVTRKETTNDQT